MNSGIWSAVPIIPGRSSEVSYERLTWFRYSKGTILSDLDQKTEDKAEAKSKLFAEKPAPPAKGPTFYRNPEGGPLVTTKPKEADKE